MSDFIAQVAGRIGELEKECASLREMLKVVGDALSEAQGEVEELRELNAELLIVIGWLEGWFQINSDGGGNHACPYCYLSNKNEPWNTIKHSNGCLIGDTIAKAEKLK